MSDTPSEKMKYEVWDYDGREKHFTSDDPVEVVHWLRKKPAEGRFFLIRTKGERFVGEKFTYDFVRSHQIDVIDDMVKRAVERGSHEGVALGILDLIDEL